MMIMKTYVKVEVWLHAILKFALAGGVQRENKADEGKR
jgi:hypothetical protein